jgi:tricorn protease-like protein
VTAAILFVTGAVFCYPVLSMRPLHGSLSVTPVVPQSSADDPGYYRQPAIHGDSIVFVAEGDLWSVPLIGGRANRLTAHPAAEGNPAISPDGKFLAFTGRSARRTIGICSTPSADTS